MAFHGHERIPNPSLVYAYCKCGWHYYIEKLKGKKDVDLIGELEDAYIEHMAKVLDTGGKLK